MRDLDTGEVAKRAGWGIAAVSVICVASSVGLRIYLDRAYIESPMLEAFKSFIFSGNTGEPLVQAPPLINLSHANMLLTWAAVTGIVAVVVLAKASLSWRTRGQSQPQAVAIVGSLLTLYCLWHSWPWFVELLRR